MRTSLATWCVHPWCKHPPHGLTGPFTRSFGSPCPTLMSARNPPLPSRPSSRSPCYEKIPDYGEQPHAYLQIAA